MRHWKLLVPIDLSENSRRGCFTQCSLGAENKGDLTVLHVANEFDAWEIYSDEFSFLESTTSELGRADLERYPRPTSNSIDSWNRTSKP
jgi:hypothetical protein